VVQRDDRLIVDDIGAIMFVSVKDQAVRGKKIMYGGFTNILEDLRVESAKQGFEDIRARLLGALDSLQRSEQEYSQAGFASDYCDFSFGYNVEQDDIYLKISGETTSISYDELYSRIKQKIQVNRKNGLIRKSKIAEKHQLEAQLARLKSEIGEE
jgi:hypothetical protein